jgi:Arc/MetJ family transcription regulator
VDSADGDRLARCMFGVWRAQTSSALIAEVMRRFGVSTKKEAVDLALRRLVGEPLTREFLLGLEGVGWDGDLKRQRREKPDEIS